MSSLIQEIRQAVIEGQGKAVVPKVEQALADTACALRARVALPAGTRYRLAGVGLSGFAEPDGSRAQDDLFA